MGTIQCYICSEDFTPHEEPLRPRFVAIEPWGDRNYICPDCESRMAERKVAIVIVKDNVKTGESIFITRQLLKDIGQPCPDQYSIWLMEDYSVRVIVRLIMELNSKTNG
jgi:hypothetical protein